MKNTCLPLAKLLAVAACALSLGSCSRAEYAMLPTGSSYHGVTRAAAPTPAAVATAKTATIPEAAPEASAATRPDPLAPKAFGRTTIPVKAATKAPAAPAEAEASAVIAAAPRAAGPAPTVTPTTALKLGLVQRVVLNKMAHQMDKLVQKATTARRHDNTASTTRRGGISDTVKLGLVLLLVGLIVASLLNSFIGAVIAIVGIIFIVYGLL